MREIKQLKSISIWVFLIPFFGLNLCLLLITKFHGLFPNQEHILHNTIPYFDGGASISRTARVFPTYLIFKPAMFITSYLLIKYWIYNKKILLNFNVDYKFINKILFFGIGSAILLTIHSIFLGIHFDLNLYKLFRKVVILLFIIFEVVAQGYLVFSLYKIKEKISGLINIKFLKLKRFLITMLVIIAIVSIPIISIPGYKAYKHALEWDFFMGVISFYLLTYFMWKKK